MLSVLAALTLAPIAYSFPAGSSQTFYVRVGLNGYLPILGGKEGNAQVDMTLAVQGLDPASDGLLKASSDLADFHLRFNGAEFPVTLETAKGYFPKNTVAFTPQGHVEVNDAPNTPLPVRLPGLDPKRFPDITYLPIEFPAEGIEEGKSWTFKKPFESLELQYTITPTHVEAAKVDMKIELSAHDEFFEDASHATTSSTDDRVFQVVSDFTGEGTANFDRKKNVIEKLAIKINQKGIVTDLKTKETSPRRLEITLDVSHDKALPASSLTLARTGAGPLDLLRNKVQQSGPVQRVLIASQLMHPRGGNWRSAVPLVRAAVNNVHVPSKVAVQRQWQDLAVLSRKTAARIPELLNVQGVQSARRFLSDLPTVVGSHWSPYHESAERLADKVVEYISPNDAGAYKAPGVRRSKDQNKARLPVSKVKAGR